MSLKNFSIAVGMSVMGSIWATPGRVSAQVETAPVPPNPPGTKAPIPTYSVLLLTNGRILKGAITEDPSGTEYILAQKGGTIRFPKREAEAAFASIEDLYRHKRDRVPKEDADEQFKLAKWCLEQNLHEQARLHLGIVLEGSPRFVEAKRMIDNLAFNAENAAAPRPTFDPAIARAGATMPAPDRLDRAALDPRVVRARNEMMRSGGIPVVFDLPPTEAVKRASEFTRTIHGILQQNCVKCHGDDHAGEFRLVRIKSRHDLTPDVIRVNLDAALSLVNREQPDASRLLTSALVPHGGSTRPVLRGPGEPAYRTLADWVGRLKYVPPAGDPAVVAAGSGGFAAERFGADRNPGAAPPRNPAGLAPAKPPQFTVVPDPRTGLPVAPDPADLYQNEPLDLPKNVVSPRVPAGTSFPQPFGTGPGVPSTILPPGATAPKAPLPSPPGAVPKDDAVGKAGAEPPAPAAKRKRKPIDPALLEKMLKGSRQTPQP